MRPRNEPARERLPTLLRREAPASAAKLAQALAVSVPTLHRMLQELGPQALISGGRARRTRHALRRSLRGNRAPIPLYRIDSDGRPERIAELSLIHPEGSFLQLPAALWPSPAESADGWWPGLPYPLYDLAPQGWLGRQFARARHRELDVPEDLRRWNDDDIAWALSRELADGTGDLILGDRALDHWDHQRRHAADPLPNRGIGRAYERLAEAALADGVPTSSAAGEFPKFAAQRERAGMATPHVIVKFSGAGGSAAEKRWADLLVCEHLALQHAAQLPGVQAPASRILRSGGRTFLEVERFDRHGLHGRSPLVSLAALEPALLGLARPDWPSAAKALAALGLLSQGDAEAVERLWWFGRLIGNTDMHLGNLSFVPGKVLKLAPVYDMLPMRWAPVQGGEVPANLVTVASATLCDDATESMGPLALRFWRTAAAALDSSSTLAKVTAQSIARFEQQR